MRRKIAITLTLILILVFVAVPVFAEPLYFSDWTNDTTIENGVAVRQYFPPVTAYWESYGRYTGVYSDASIIDVNLRTGYNTTIYMFPFGQDKELPLEAFKSGSTLSLDFKYGIRYYGTTSFTLKPRIRYYDKNNVELDYTEGDSFTLTDDEAIAVPILMEIPADAVYAKIELFMSGVPSTNEAVTFEFYEASFIWTYNLDEQSAMQGEQILSAMDKLIYGYEYEAFGSIFDEVTSAEDFIWQEVADSEYFLEDTVLSFLDILYLYSGAFEFLGRIFEMFMFVDIYNGLLLVSLALGSFALMLGAVAIFVRRDK